MEVGKLEIVMYDRRPRPYMPICRCKVSFENGNIKLREAEGQAEFDKALAVLLTSPGVYIGRMEDVAPELIPCFDLSEMSRRNKAKQKEIR